MEPKNESVRDRLLARLPQPENLAAYREGVEASLKKNQRTLRRQRWYSGAIWVYAVGLFTAFVVIGSQRLNWPPAVWVEMALGLLVIGGSVELLKYFINRNRVEILKEIKQVQLQVLELQASLRKADENQR